MHIISMSMIINVNIGQLNFPLMVYTCSSHYAIVPVNHDHEISFCFHDLFEHPLPQRWMRLYYSSNCHAFIRMHMHTKRNEYMIIFNLGSFCTSFFADKFDDFWSINKKMMLNARSEPEPFKSIPFAVYRVSW